MSNATERAQIKAKFGGRCSYCGCVLSDRWHVDHVEPILRTDGAPQWPERDVEANKFPACIPCNNFKGVFSVEEFRRELFQQVTRCRKTSVNFRMAEKYKQLSVIESPIIFYFEHEVAYQSC